MSISQDDLVERDPMDRGVLGELYKKHFPKILGHCIRKLNNKIVAQDVTADIFLRAVEHIQDFVGRTDSDFSKWLYGITVNETNAHIRKKRRRKKLREEAIRKGAMAVGNCSDPPSDDHLDWPVLYEAIQRLKPRQRRAIKLRYLEDMDTAEIAGILDMKPGAVRTMLSRATHTLRKYLGDRFEES